MTDYSSPRVVIRPALPRDKEDVAGFTKFIWDGHDYVGHVFPEWLADPRGQLLVAEYAGRCVATGKVTFLAPGQWWLEGFRVDPDFQGLKIGSRLDAACNEWWDAHGNGRLRLMTSAKRVQVHHLSESRGFVKTGEVLGYEAAPLNEAAGAFTPLAPGEAQEALAFCQRANVASWMNIGWRFVAPNAESWRAAAEEGTAWWWRGRRGIVSAWEDDEDGAPSLTVGFDACADKDRASLLEEVRRLAHTRAAVVTKWMNAINETAIQNLQSAGYVRAWEEAGFLYQRDHP